MTLMSNLQKILILATMICLSGCVTVPWDETKNKGETPEEQLKIAEERVAKHPNDSAYRKDLLVLKSRIVQRWVAQAKALQAQGQYDHALAMYDKVLIVMPNHISAYSGKAEIKREVAHAKKLADAESLANESKSDEAEANVHEVLLENPNSAAAQAVAKTISVKAGIVDTKPPRLKPRNDKPISLELKNANIKVAFQALSKSTGINFILDNDIKPNTKVTLFVKSAKVADAIEMVLASNGLNKKVLSENSAFVYPNTPKKLKDYQDLMIRSFYLTNADAKQVGNLIKTMLKTKDVFTDERLNMVVIRDTPDVIRLAEKLVYGNDVADPEVMLEVEVLEIARSRLQRLGVNYPNQIATLATDAEGAATALTLDNIEKLSSDNYLLGGFLDGGSNGLSADFLKTLDDVNTLSNPRVRVRNREKANFHVGEKVPYFQSNVAAGTAGGSNVLTENVQYLDVGLKVELEPRITLDNHVNINIDLEVNNIVEQVTSTNGSTAFTVGTRTTSTTLRLKDGETQILAGLIQDEEFKNTRGIPGLVDLPILGRLFSRQQDDVRKSEIVLAITPRIITNIQTPSSDKVEYWSGTQSKLTDKPNVLSAPVLTPAERARERAAERARAIKEKARKRREAARRAREERDVEQGANGDDAEALPNSNVVPVDGNTTQDAVPATVNDQPLNEEPVPETNAPEEDI